MKDGVALAEACGLKTVSLMDGYSEKRISVACRGRKCVHASVFDLGSYVAFNVLRQQAPKCPVCCEALGSEDLLADELVARLLSFDEDSVDIDVDAKRARTSKKTVKLADLPFPEVDARLTWPVVEEAEWRPVITRDLRKYWTATSLGEALGLTSYTADCVLLLADQWPLPMPKATNAEVADLFHTVVPDLQPFQAKQLVDLLSRKQKEREYVRATPREKKKRQRFDACVCGSALCAKLAPPFRCPCCHEKRLRSCDVARHVALFHPADFQRLTMPPPPPVVTPPRPFPQASRHEKTTKTTFLLAAAAGQQRQQRSLFLLPNPS